MLVEWEELGITEKNIDVVLTDAKGSSCDFVDNPLYYHSRIVDHSKRAYRICKSRGKKEETEEEYEERIKIKAREATEMTLRAIAEREAEECIKTS